MEIGTEEIPARFIPDALFHLKEIATETFKTKNLIFDEISTQATPRRLTLIVRGLSITQGEIVHERLGPPYKKAFNEDGSPTKAATGFAKRFNITISDLQIVDTDKGKYIAVRKVEKGRETASLLPEILPEIILSLPFPKSMRWQDLDIRFARPIHWIVALFGCTVIHFPIGNIESKTTTQGHRFMSKGALIIQEPSHYEKILEENFVMVDHTKRQNIIQREAIEHAHEVDGEIYWNESLLETVANLVEYPFVFLGKYEKTFLSLPREVLISSMVEHQKFFPIVGKDSELLPYFVNVLNTKPNDPDLVIKGNERVLAARLSDADFFFREDLKAPLECNVEALKEVTFLEKLGSMYEKCLRVQKIGERLSKKIDKKLTKKVTRAAKLSKADLLTHMVGEFPNLQGVMGKHYALASGEDTEVAEALYEHYLPTHSGGHLPETLTGSLLAISDKIDTICGCFIVDLIPTGSQDPFGLRRHSLGIVSIILEHKLPIFLEELIDMTIATYPKKLITQDKEKLVQEILNFFTSRLQNLFISIGYSYDIVNAATYVHYNSPGNAKKMIEALSKLRAEDVFDGLITISKRVTNILGHQGNFGKIDPSLFYEESEVRLYRAYQETKEEVGIMIDNDDYYQGLVRLAMMRQPIDNFFDTVLVMAEDAELRNNRLALLSHLKELFLLFGDFAHIV